MVAIELPATARARRIDVAVRSLRLALVTIAGLWWLTGCSLFAGQEKIDTPPPPPMPNVTGLDIEEAIATLEARGYVVESTWPFVRCASRW